MTTIGTQKRFSDVIDDAIHDDSLELFAAIEEHVKDYIKQNLSTLKLGATAEQIEILEKFQRLLELM